MMPVGSKWILYIPSNLAFGNEGYSDIAPGSTLIFEVELLGIQKDPSQGKSIKEYLKEVESKKLPD